MRRMFVVIAAVTMLVTVLAAQSPADHAPIHSEELTAGARGLFTAGPNVATETPDGDGWVYSGWSDATENDFTPQYASIDSGYASRTQSVAERYNHPFSVMTRSSRHSGPRRASEWQLAIVCERSNGTTYSILTSYSNSTAPAGPGCISFALSVGLTDEIRSERLLPASDP